MRQLQRIGDVNSGGGTITTTPQSTVYVNSRLVAVTGSRGTGHGTGLHGAGGWMTGIGIGSIQIDCHSVNTTGDTDTCGHVRIGGSDNVFIGQGGDSSMGCTASDITYVTPEGITALYTPSAVRTMGSEAVNFVSKNDPPGAVMSDKEDPEAPPAADPVTCGEFTENTEYTVQLSTNYTLNDVTTKTVTPHRIPQGGTRGLTKPEIICNLKQMCETVAEVVRARIIGLGHPRLTISSGFRNNEATSHHGVGAALDLQVLSMRPQEMFELAQWMRDSVPLDQIILEGVGASHHWIHASLPLKGTRTVVPSVRVLTQTASNTYAHGLFLLNYGRG